MNTKQVIKQLEFMITQANEEKENYYAEGNGVDTYVMNLVGRIDGYEEAIKLLKRVSA